MARRRSKLERARARFAPGEHWAAIPVEVLSSTAYAALPDYATRVLLAVAAGYRGSNNGALSLTQAQAARLGVTQAWKVAAGLQLLVMTGLLEQTRQGKYKYGKPLCGLYALSWKAIDPTDQAFPPIEAARPPQNRWARWVRPAEWNEVEREVRTRLQGKAGRVSDFSPIHPGVSEPINPGVSELPPADQPGCIGNGGNPINPGVCPLESPPGGRASGGRASGGWAPSGPRPDPPLSKRDEEGLRRVQKLHRLQPHLPPGDLARITKTSLELATSVVEARP